MGKTIVYKDATWQGKHLRLVLQTTEGSREYQAIIVALELSTVIMTHRMTVFLSQATIGD